MLGPFFLGKGAGPTSLEQRLKNLFRDRGARYMIISAFLAACGVTITKFSYRYVSPLEFVFFSLCAAILGTSAMLIIRGVPFKFKLNASLLGMSLSYSVVAALHAVGLSLLFAAYFISLKRLSVIFDVFLGRIVHQEDHFRERLIGALFMAAGVLLIAFG